MARYVKYNLIIQIIRAELLVFYYAISSWRSPIPNGITVYKKSSFIALQVMLIHAIIVTTLRIHYWLHDKAPLLSIILLVLNIYSLLFFLGDMQALRLNPIYATNNSIYISLGLMKRTEIHYTNIEAIIDEPEILQKKLSKNTVDFMIRDFEKVYPDIILKMKKPQKVTLFMGREKEFDFVAIRSDYPEQLKQLIEVNTMK